MKYYQKHFKRSHDGMRVGDGGTMFDDDGYQESLSYHH